MAEETTETTEVVAEPAEAVAETASESVVEAPAEQQDNSWDTPLAFPTEASTEDEEPVAEETATPEVNESAEENETAEAEPEAQEADEEVDEEVLTAEADRPAPYSRRKLRDAEQKVLIPFRDPDAPVKDVFKGLAEINPQRAEQLAVELVHDAIQAYPDQWVEYITGIEGATVETIKNKFSGEPQETTDAFQTVVDSLTETYGDTWRDASQDDYLLDEHKEVAQALREHLSKGSEVTTEKDAKIQELENQLASLQPQIEDIRTKQEAEFERFVVETKQKSQNEYQQAVMKRVVPKLIEEHGLKVSEQDSPIVKKAKEELAGRLSGQVDGDMSDFEYFALSRFSGKDDLIKKIGRVEKYFDLAAKAEADARRVKDANKRAQLQQTAEAYRADAKQEQDSFVVLSRKAGKEFLENSGTMELLEHVAHLQTQLSQANFRPEIVGQAAIAGASSYRDKINQADDPWAVPMEL
jgi:hypothetical protein